MAIHHKRSFHHVEFDRFHRRTGTPDPEVCLGKHITLDRVIDTVIQTAEYMRQIESEPPLTAGVLEGDYWLLAAFNGIVLAGYPPQHDAHWMPKLL